MPTSMKMTQWKNKQPCHCTTERYIVPRITDIPPTLKSLTKADILALIIIIFIPNSFVFHRVTPTELELEVMLIPLKKSYGLYSCPAWALKCARHILYSPLADIINKSVETGIYPDKLKHAKIIPIFKSDEETEVSNYRPILLLSIFNRIFEKMMSIRLKNFLQIHDVLYQNQYGFRENHSTEHAILDLVYQIQINMG